MSALANSGHAPYSSGPRSFIFLHRARVPVGGGDTGNFGVPTPKRLGTIEARARFPCFIHQSRNTRLLITNDEARSKCALMVLIRG
jgi:hypothetical protein